MGWNFGDILDGIGPVIPSDSPAFIHGKRVITWGETIRRSNNLAKALLDGGATYGDKVAFYMRNRPEYVEGVAACYKARLVHVNINYRYTADEVFYIFDNSDATVVIYGAEFRAIVTELRPRLTKVKQYVEVSDGGPVADFARDYNDLAAKGSGQPLGIERSPDDLLFIYTGGTTGMPKGVMWPQHDLREVGLHSARKLGPVPETLAETIEAVRVTPGPRTLPAPPLMHGTGLLTGLAAHTAGGCVVTLTSPSFDAVEALDAIEAHKVQNVSLVGDAFARPMLKALDANPGRWDLSSLVGMISSGVMWSVEVKRGLLRHMPAVALTDSFGSSEAVGMGLSVMTAEGEVPTARFALDERCMVIDENDRPVTPGSGIAGRVALGPPNPLGYYKDEAKTVATFRVINGVRYSMPGDFCLVEADGSLTLLGRGSVCINTAGEKVFPEEVEEALKTHDSIDDALVVGVPDETWGQAVTAVIELAPGGELDEDQVRQHVRQSLAGYKVPKRIIIADKPLRAANGKADYKTATNQARDELQVAG